jgi:ubiquinone biosynthesis protein COQ9
MRDINHIIHCVKQVCPDVNVEQLQVAHAGADDDGLWFFKRFATSLEVQIESSDGMCPFTVETNEDSNRYTVRSVEESIEILCKLLHCKPVKQS